MSKCKIWQKPPKPTIFHPIMCKVRFRVHFQSPFSWTFDLKYCYSWFLRKIVNQSIECQKLWNNFVIKNFCAYKLKKVLGSFFSFFYRKIFAAWKQAFNVLCVDNCVLITCLHLRVIKKAQILLWTKLF